MKKIYLAVSILALAGCATTQPFQPTEHARTTLDKQVVAHYSVRTGPGDFGLINVVLKTEGVPGDVKNGAPPPQILIKMDATNNSSQAVLLDTAQLGVNLFVDDKKQADMIRPVPIPVDSNIGSHSNKEFILTFPLPAGIKLKQISAFELAWGLALGSENYVQKTGFSRDANSGNDSYYVYDPMFYPYGSVGYYGGSGRSRSSLNLGFGFGIGN